MASFFGHYSIISHLHVFQWEPASLWIQLLLLSLHLSFIDQLLGSHSMETSSNCPCFLLQLFFLNASCFARQMVVRSTFLHPSKRVSFSHFELRTESSISSELARQWSPFSVFCFVSKFVFLARFSLPFFSLSRIKRKKLATGFDPLPSELTVAC